MLDILAKDPDPTISTPALVLHTQDYLQVNPYAGGGGGRTRSERGREVFYYTVSLGVGVPYCPYNDDNDAKVSAQFEW